MLIASQWKSLLFVLCWLCCCCCCFCSGFGSEFSVFCFQLDLLEGKYSQVRASWITAVVVTAAILASSSSSSSSWWNQPKECSKSRSSNKFVVGHTHSYDSYSRRAYKMMFPASKSFIIFIITTTRRASIRTPWVLLELSSAWDSLLRGYCAPDAAKIG